MSEQPTTSPGPQRRPPAISEQPVTTQPSVGSGNGATWAREFQAWQRRSRQRLSRTRLAIVTVLVVAAVAYGVYWWQYSATHVSTDDAFIVAHIAPVSARIPGPVTVVAVDDNQEVKVGDVLVRLDARDYQVALTQAQAAVEAARGDLQNALANVPLTDESTGSLLREADAALGAIGHAQEIAEHDLEQRRSDLAAKQAAVGAARAQLDAAQADFGKAKLDLDRLDALFRQQLIAKQDLDHADAQFKSAQAMLELARHKIQQTEDDARQAKAAVDSQGAAVAQARQRVVQARATRANAQSQRRQVSVRQAQVETAQGRLRSALAALSQAQLNLDYTTITAPSNGRVTRKTVEVGQVVAPGQALLSLVNLDDVWVVANFKETQLAHVRPGQAARIKVDTYPGTVFKARVDSLQGGSGAVFSLLPPENATGNYVKVVQRIPVKLVLEPGENARRLLVPGMSVVPTIVLR